MADQVKTITIKINGAEALVDINEIKNALKETGDKTKELKETNLGNFRSQLSGLKDSFIAGEIGAKGLAQGVLGVGKAMIMAFITNPVGIAIAAIGAAVLVLYNVFKDFKPLVDKIEQSFAALGAVWNVLKNGIMGLVTGNKSLTETFNGLGDSMAQAAKDAVALKKAEQDLEDSAAALEVSNKKAETQIQKLLLQSKDRTKSEKERMDLINEALAVEAKAFEEKKKFNEQETANAYEAIRIKNQLSDEEMLKLKEGGIAYARELQNRKLLSDEEILKLKDTLIKKEDIEQQSVAIVEKSQNRKNELADAEKAKQDKAVEDAKVRSEKIAAAKQQADEKAAAEAQKLYDLEKEISDKRVDALSEYNQSQINITDELAKFEANQILDKGKRLNELIKIEDDYYAKQQAQIQNSTDNEILKAQKLSELDANHYMNKVDLLNQFAVIEREKSEKRLEGYEKDIQADFDSNTKSYRNRSYIRSLELEEIEDQHNRKLLSEEEYEAKVLEITRKNTEDRKLIHEKLIQATAQSMNDLSNLNQAVADTQINKEKEKLEKGIINQTEYDKSVDKIKKKAFDRDKKIAIATTLINTAQSVIKTGAELGYPLAIPFQVIAAALGIAQIAKIKSSQYESADSGTGSLGSGGGSTATTTSTAPNTSFNFTKSAETPNQVAPIQTFVLTKEVTTSQQFERQVISNATL